MKKIRSLEEYFGALAYKERKKRGVQNIADCLRIGMGRKKKSPRERKRCLNMIQKDIEEFIIESDVELTQLAKLEAAIEKLNELKLDCRVI